MKAISNELPYIPIRQSGIEVSVNTVKYKVKYKVSVKYKAGRRWRVKIIDSGRLTTLFVNFLTVFRRGGGGGGGGGV